MEFCTSIYCTGHKNKYKNFYKQWWGSCDCFIVDRETLRTIYWCYIRENIFICGNCKNCFNCKRLKKIEQACKNASLFYNSEYPSCQAIKWKVFFFTYEDDLNFRLEIHDTEKMKKKKKRWNNLWFMAVDLFFIFLL